MKANKLLDIAKNAINELEESEYEHGAILEYLNITEEEYNKIVNLKSNNKVYEILLQYSTDDGSSVDSFIFDSYEKAVKKFKELIEEEKIYIEWVKNAFESEETLKDYEFETNIDEEYKDNLEHELYWEITDKYDWYQHDYFELRITEVK